MSVRTKKSFHHKVDSFPLSQPLSATNFMSHLAIMTAAPPRLIHLLELLVAIYEELSEKVSNRHDFIVISSIMNKIVDRR